jgi:hypothetical protein
MKLDPVQFANSLHGKVGIERLITLRKWESKVIRHANQTTDTPELLETMDSLRWVRLNIEQWQTA